MSDNEVKYTMTLHDMLSDKIKSAEKSVNRFELSLHDVGRAAQKFSGILATTVGVAAGLELVTSSLHDFMASENSIAQLQAGIASTGGAAGVSIDYLTDSAKRFSQTLPFAKDQIMDMQSQLLTFPSITKATFGDASTAIMDMATRLHRGLDETAIMVGKALQDPARGITALRRVGVNFNDEQTKIIKNLVETGHAGEAQVRILKELQTEFAGSSTAAAGTFSGQMQIMRNQITNYKEELGATIAQLIIALKPAMEWVIQKFGEVVGLVKNVVTWFKENKGVAEVLGTSLGVLAGVLATYEIVTYGAAVAMKLATVGQWLWNIAIGANPIGLLIIGISAAIVVIVECYKHFGVFRGVLMGVWETVKEFGRIVSDIFVGVGKTIHGVLHFNPSEIIDGVTQTISAIGSAGLRIGHAFKTGYDEGMADFAVDQAAKTTAIAPHAITKKGAAGAPGAPGTTGKTDKAPKGQGAKNITININGGLIHSFVTNVKNMQEGVKDLRDHVTAALLSAVNDSQIIAGE